MCLANLFGHLFGHFVWSLVWPICVVICLAISLLICLVLPWALGPCWLGPYPSWRLISFQVPMNITKRRRKPPTGVPKQRAFSFASSRAKPGLPCQAMGGLRTPREIPCETANFFHCKNNTSIRRSPPHWWHNDNALNKKIILERIKRTCKAPMNNFKRSPQNACLSWSWQKKTKCRRSTASNIMWLTTDNVANGQPFHSSPLSSWSPMTAWPKS